MSLNIPPRGQVTKEQKRCLEKYRGYLIDELDGEVLLPNLRRDGILDHADDQYISSKVTNREKNIALVDIILCRTSVGFEAFMKALEETGYANAFNTLKDFMEGWTTNGNLKETSGVSSQFAGKVEKICDLLQQAQAETVKLTTTADLLDEAYQKIAQMEEEKKLLIQENDALREELHDVKYRMQEIQQTMTKREEEHQQDINKMKGQMQELVSRVEKMEANYGNKENKDVVWKNHCNVSKVAKIRKF